jgi:hypothetical protein
MKKRRGRPKKRPEIAPELVEALKIVLTGRVLLPDGRMTLGSLVINEEHVVKIMTIVKDHGYECKAKSV